MQLSSISRQLLQVIRAFKQNNVMQITTVINYDEKCIPKVYFISNPPDKSMEKCLIIHLTTNNDFEILRNRLLYMDIENRKIYRTKCEDNI